MTVDYCDWDLVKHEKLVFQIIKEDQTPVTYQYPETSLAKIIDKEFNMTRQDFTNEYGGFFENRSEFFHKFKCIVSIYRTRESYRRQKYFITYIKERTPKRTKENYDAD